MNNNLFFQWKGEPGGPLLWQHAQEARLLEDWVEEGDQDRRAEAGHRQDLRLLQHARRVQHAVQSQWHSLIKFFKYNYIKKNYGWKNM